MNESLETIKTHYLATRANAIARYRQRPNPQRLLHRLSQAADHSLRQLFQLFPLPKGAACLALGGYGRQALYPHSDVDLLFLIPAPLECQAEQERLAQLIAACWDLGLAISHTVETLEQCLSRCHHDIALQTALLEARYLAGNKQLWRTLQSLHLQQLDLGQFYELKRAEMKQRHAAYQNTPYALEPNCKESPGGLRDLQLLGWLAHAAGVGKNWAEIAHSGLLTQAEQKAIERASLALMRLRIELHLLTARAEDTLRFDLQPQLARIYGFHDTNSRLGSEMLMQRYYWATRLVTQLMTTLLQSFDEITHPRPIHEFIQLDEHFALVNQRLKLIHPTDLAAHPENLLRGFIWLQKHPQIQGFDALTLRALWHGRKLIDETFRQQPTHKQLFLDILKSPRCVYQSLALLNLFNILPRYIPAFRAVVGQMQHDLFHVYTVDQHILRVIEYLEHFQHANARSTTPLAHQLIRDFPNRWRLYLAALFHDIGKGQGGSHAQRGAQMARQFCLSHYLCPQDTTFIEFLVREHLLFSHYAQKEDFYNPEVLHRFISIVDSIEKLNAIYLLTIADIQATNPNIWTNWKASLFDSLYHQARSLLINQQSSAEILSSRRQSAQRYLQSILSQNKYAHSLWRQLDADYFARHPLNTIAWHFHTFAEHDNEASPIVVNLRELPCNAHSDTVNASPPLDSASQQSNRSLWQVMVHTQDQPELFMTLCEVFERLGLSIQDAHIYTNPNGWVLDTFVVQPIAAINIDCHDIQLFSQALTRALLRLYDHPPPLPTEGFSYHDARSARARVFPLSPSVQLRPLDAQCWELSIIGTDRKGLLFDISRTFAHKKLNLRAAKIMTQGERVEDSFVLKSPKLLDNHFRAELIRDILRLLN